MLTRALLLVAAGLVIASACTNRAGGGPADAARGERYFKAKCNACHPNGGQGAGPALIGKVPPGPLKKSSTGGRHNVPEQEWDSLLLYLTPLMQPQAAAPPPPPPPAPPVAAPPPPPPAPPVAPPAAAPGTKTCNCTCQCPTGTPPGQMQACTCQCSCPPG